MTTYAAFLRGIGPGNPNMHNSKLRAVFESLGFEDVRSVLASGNIIFSSNERSKAKLEDQIEQALTAQLGLSSQAIVRSQAELQEIVHKQPFGKHTHQQKTYLTVTFIKKMPSHKVTIPYQNADKTFCIFGFDQKKVVYGIIDTTMVKGGEFMNLLEKQFGTNITTRTWLTVQRILAACNLQT